MKQMVYCKLKKKENASARYYVGRTIDDMTGVARFYISSDQPPELIKQAERYKVWNRLLQSINGKYRDAFLSGNFRDKLSIEI